MKRFCVTVLLAYLLTTPVMALEPATVQALEQGDSEATVLAKAAHVVPSPRQLAYQQREYSGFIHFGPNTFTGKEWGNGKEDPAVFNPTDLDADQWCRVMQGAGMRTVVITAKHHDGFVLWPSRYTRHGVVSSPWRQGQGDVLRELVDACRSRGLKIGFYLSPADLFQIESADGLYGNLSEYTERTIPREAAGRPFTDTRRFTVRVDDYNEYFMNQLFELLTEYGPVHEVWFDGAHPKRKGGQTYVRDDWYRMIRELAPEAVIFGGPDARWVGNEAGDTRATEWSVIPMQGGEENLDRVDKDLGSRQRLYDPRYTVYGRDLVADQLRWVVAEVDTSIRHGWFYRDEQQAVRSADNVFDIYERSVGGNSVFLLNVPPDRRGRLHERDVAVLLEVGERIRKTYGEDLLAGASGPDAVLDTDDNTFWQPPGDSGELELRLPEPRQINRFLLQEAIASHGQRIEQHALDAWVNGSWLEVASGTTVGYKKILRFEAVTTSRVRLRITASRLQPTLSKLSAHYYHPHPAAVMIEQDARDRVALTLPTSQRFTWNRARQPFDAADKRQRTVIRYTTDGSEPDAASPIYQGPFSFAQGGVVRARAFIGDEPGPVAEQAFSVSRRDWKVLAASSAEAGPWYQPGRYGGARAVDGNPDTAWIAVQQGASLSLDLGQELTLAALTYLPARDSVRGRGMLSAGRIEASDDAEQWRLVETFTFGNIINDPGLRTHYFKQPLQTRYLRVVITQGALLDAAPGIAELGLLPAVEQ